MQKTPVGRLQVLSLLCPRSLQRMLSRNRSLMLLTSSRGSAEYSQSNGVCDGKQHSPPHCWAVTPSHLAMESSPQGRNPSFLNQYIPHGPAGYRDQQFLSWRISVQRKSWSRVYLTDSVWSEKVTKDILLPADRHNPCMVLPENILCSFKAQANVIFSWSSRISPGDLHTTGH